MRPEHRRPARVPTLSSTPRCPGAFSKAASVRLHEIAKGKLGAHCPADERHRATSSSAQSRHLCSRRDGEPHFSGYCFTKPSRNASSSRMTEANSSRLARTRPWRHGCARHPARPLSAPTFRIRLSIFADHVWWGVAGHEESVKEPRAGTSSLPRDVGRPVAPAPIASPRGPPRCEVPCVERQRQSGLGSSPPRGPRVEFLGWQRYQNLGPGTERASSPRPNGHEVRIGALVGPWMGHNAKRQLSVGAFCRAVARCSLVARAGFEPATFGL